MPTEQVCSSSHKQGLESRRKSKENNTKNGMEGLHFEHIVNNDGDDDSSNKNSSRRLGGDCDGSCLASVDMKKRKRDVNCNVDESHAGCQEMRNSADSEDDAHVTVSKMLENDIDMKAKLTDEYHEDSIEIVRVKKKEKKKREKREKNNDVCSGMADIGRDTCGATEENENPSMQKTAENVNEAPEKGEEKDNKSELVQGKWFSEEEDEIIKKAVFKFIERHELGDEGLNMLLNSRSFPNLKGCWNEIGAALPSRPNKAVYSRAQKLFRKGDSAWTEEEYEFVRKYQEKHGNRWTDMANKLGKFGVHVMNAWLRRKLPNRKKGHWSQEECQALFDLVNNDLQSRVSKEKKSKHGMLRDNIRWIEISDKLATRSNDACCLKWYYQLTSPMVAEGKWTDADDYRLIDALYELDASCIENVDWDSLLGHRSGDVTLKRWRQMVRHIGNHENKSFAEQVEILAQRYCPYMLEAREAWDSKPYVP
ncbi:unnamed protein product [Cuscuta campestris]|uniref:Myb-like domain-containing protein n=1 Tax=Cuscuta campestris TaxID=132261 RepID=A0A484M606_9ASTE|nr:unnamed protein product [Cuscuta campestris]